ncbi:MAG: helix-turn-helix domain-containing protein [Micromonosporaceae bacterium]
MLLMPPTEPALAPFVQSFGYLEAAIPYARERVLPSGGMQLLVNLADDELLTHHASGPRRHSGAVLQGPYDRPSVIDTAAQRAIAWVTFHPGGAAPFFAEPSRLARGTLIDLDALWGHDGAALRERLLDAPTPRARLALLQASLLARARSLNPDPLIRYAVTALERGATVTDVTDRTGLLPKRFGRLFTDRLGLTPKRFAGVRRFQRLLTAIARSGAEPDFARLAVEGGYYDQPHMIHDFQRFAEMPPTAYRPRSVSTLNHVPLEEAG